MSTERLTTKQNLFLTNYLVGMSGTEAAAQAYNVQKRTTAAVIASQNLKRLNIAKLVNGYSSKV